MSGILFYSHVEGFFHRLVLWLTSKTANFFLPLQNSLTYSPVYKQRAIGSTENASQGFISMTMKNPGQQSQNEKKKPLE